MGTKGPPCSGSPLGILPSPWWMKTPGGGRGKGKEIWLRRLRASLTPFTGSSQIENIQPFSAKDLSIRSLGDRIRDLVQLKNLYPNKPKDEAFRSHYKRELKLVVLTPCSHCVLLPIDSLPGH